MGETLAALAVLFALAGRKGDEPLQHDAGHSANTPPTGGSTDAGKAIAGVVGSALGVVGSVLGGGGTTAVVGGGTAAAGATGATSATVGTGGTAGVTGTATGGTVAGATLGPLGGFVASGAAATTAIVAIIVAFIIADQVNKALEAAKDFQGAALQLNINANALNRFEAELVRGYLRSQGRTWSEESVRDFRFDQMIAGQHVQTIGRRVIIRSIVNPGDAAVMAKIRLMALFYLRWRATYGYRLIKAWGIVANPPANFGYSADLLRAEYEAILPNVGNLLGVPHAWGGVTVVPRKDPEEVLPDALELVGSNLPYQYPTGALSVEEEKVARFAAITDAALVCRWDTRGLDGDPQLYAKSLVDALQWNGNTVAGLELRGETAWLDPAEFGCGRGVYINPTLIRAGSGGGLREGA